MQIKVSNSQ